MWSKPTRSLARKRGTLPYAKAMLFIDDGQTQPSEPDFFLHERVGPDDEVHFTG